MNVNDKKQIVINAVSEYLQISEEVIKSKCRDSAAVKARNYVLILLRYMLGMTFKEISSFLNKDYSTLVRNFQKISTNIIRNEELNGEIKHLKEIIDFKTANII